MATFPSEEIKTRLDIGEVISGYVRLQKQGANLRALCPFHKEKSPSFYVSPARQVWHCFGCGEGGDMFKFVMKMEGVEFVEALRILAKRAGVTLSGGDPKTAGERAQLVRACAQAAAFFTSMLNAPAGKEARTYLENRGLSEETVREFRLGWAPDEWDALREHLAVKGLSTDLMERAGLVLASDKSGRKKYFDRFRGRVMFPIADANGDVVGFTGRYLKERENEGKYVNSPQTPIFNKSSVLYGVDKTKTEMRKADVAVLVEGQMDMLMAWQDGVRNVVAVSGTAFTREQLDLLKRYTKNLRILFDADPAGDMATRRSIALALERGFSLSVAQVPEGKDPADFVREHPRKLADEIARAVSVMDYYFNSVKKKYDPAMVEGKKAISSIILAQIKKIPHRVEAHHWLGELSVLVGTKMEYLEEEMNRMPNNPDFLDEREQGEALPQTTSRQRTPADKLLEHLMVLLYAIKEPEVRKRLAGELAGFEFLSRLREDPLLAAGFASPAVLEVFDFFMKYAIMGRLAEDMSAELDEAGKSIRAEVLLMAELEAYEDAERELRSTALRLERDLIARKLAELEAELKRAEAEKDAAGSERLFAEVTKLSMKKVSLAS